MHYPLNSPDGLGKSETMVKAKSIMLLAMPLYAYN